MQVCVCGDAHLKGLQSLGHNTVCGEELMQESQGRGSGGSSEVGSLHRQLVVLLGPCEQLHVSLEQASGEQGDVPCGDFCIVAGQEVPAEEM